MNTNQKKKTGNTSVVATVIAAICIVIYLTALVQAAVRFYINVEQRKNQIDRDFDSIAGLALNTGNQGFMDQYFIDTINHALSLSQTLEAVIITGPDGAYAFEKQRGFTVTWVNNTPRFINKFGITTQGLHRVLPIQSLRNVNIQAAASSYNYSEFTKILKETLLIIIVGFTTAFFTMLLQFLSAGKQEEKFAQIRKQENKKIQETEPSAKRAVTSEGSPPDIDDEAEIDFDDIDTPEVTTNDSAPKGLYSPRGNIGWEEYLKDRLESELHRCASTEKDLTLLDIELTDKLNDIQFKQAADEVVSFFSSRDLLFERGKQGIIVINPGVDLNASLDKAQKLYQRLREKIFFGNGKNELNIGLTSRAGRLLNAERMMLEAHEALQKAKADYDTNIIAFKSDLEKYRKFIASQSSKSS